MIVSEIKKIIPEYQKWFVEREFNQMNEDDHVSRIEHEIDLFREWKDEGFQSREEATSLTGQQVRKLNGLLKRYYNGNIKGGM